MPLIGKAIAAALRVLSWVGTACILLMMLHVAADVVMRYLFNSPLPGTLNIVSRYYMVAVVFLSLAVAERQDAHISVEILYDRLPAGARRALAPLAWLLTALTFAAIAVRSGEVAWSKTLIRASVDEGTTTIPVWQSYWLVAIGSALVAILALWRLALALLGRPDPHAAAHTENLNE